MPSGSMWGGPLPSPLVSGEKKKLLAHFIVHAYACCPTWPWTWGRAQTRRVWERRLAAWWQGRTADWGAARWADRWSLCCWASPVAAAAAAARWAGSTHGATAGALGGATAVEPSGAPAEVQAGIWELCTAKQKQELWGKKKALEMFPDPV